MPIRHMTTLPVPSLLFCTLNLQLEKENCSPVDYHDSNQCHHDAAQCRSSDAKPTLSGAFLLSISGKMRSCNRVSEPSRLPSQPYMKTLFLRLCPWKSQYSTTSRSTKSLQVPVRIQQPTPHWLPVHRWPHLSTMARRCQMAGKEPRDPVL